MAENINSEISKTVLKQREFYYTNKTLDVNYRINALKKLRKAVKENEKALFDAMKKDFNKCHFESYGTEIGQFYEEINYSIKKLKKWVKPKKVKTPLVFWPAKSYIYPESYGVVLIISPWNYPFLLLMDPLVGSISAGNCTVLKPADYTKNTSKVIKKIIEEIFNPEYVSIFTGGRDVNKALLEEKYDYIFFTGSPYLGRIVMEKASKNLTPITLELGGKSPCIIDEDAKLETAAKRVVWGKMLNGGQTCIAPDYLFLHKNIKEEFIMYLKKYIKEFYSQNPQQSKDFPRIINEKHFDRLCGLMKKGNIVIGGQADKKDLYISPTVIDNISPDDPIMQEEIFGPVFPVMEFENIEEVVDYIIRNPKPLALYYFTKNNKKAADVIKKTSFGGGCINDTIVHAGSTHLPFGGVGNSGMGGYHGKATFDTFTHYKSVLKKSNSIDIDLRYPPYKNKLKIIKKILK